MGTSGHYDNVAETYEDAYFYEDNSPFQQWMLQQVFAHLRLAEHHRVRRKTVHAQACAPRALPPSCTVHGRDGFQVLGL
jgi:hypothetical protein